MTPEDKPTNSDVQDVNIVNPKVQDVNIINDPKALKDATGTGSRMTETQRANLPAQTTIEQDKRTLGQREVNLIWEHTQRQIAVFVVIMGCSVAAFVVIYSLLKGSSADPLVLAAFTLLSNICFLVAGFYFGRTNHARIGDDGTKPQRSSGGLDDR